MVDPLLGIARIVRQNRRPSRQGQRMIDLLARGWLLRLISNYVLVGTSGGRHSRWAVMTRTSDWE